MSALQAGTVRSAVSGDTLTVIPRGAPPTEFKTIHVAGLNAPRLGTRDRPDEPGAYAARDHLRLMAVGKPVRWRTAYTVPGPADQPQAARQYVHVFLPPVGPGQSDRNVAVELLAHGFARVHDGRSATMAPNPEDAWREPLHAAQQSAQQSAVGLWALAPPSQPTVHKDMPARTIDFFNTYKNELLDAVVEQVKDGSMLRLRLLLSPSEHQFINLGLAAARSPRFVSHGDSSNEPWAEQATQFVDSKLLQRNVKVRLLSVPPSASASPAMSTLLANGGSAPADQGASHLIGTVLHPAGDIAQFLLSNGLAKVVDWHAGALNAGFPGKIDQYRAAERQAKEQRRGIWTNWSAPAARASVPPGAPSASGPKINGRTLAKGTILEGTVVRVVSPDSLLIQPSDGALEQRVYFSSLRAPPGRDEQLAGYAADAREWLRSKTVSKLVRVQVDYIKPRDGEFAERVYGTVHLIKKLDQPSLGEQLVSQGLLLVQRHRKDDDDVASTYTELVTAEATAQAARKGLHSGQPKILPRVSEASETAARANTFLSGFKRAGKLDAVVEHVAGPARVRLYVPRENARLTLVLSGIRAPRTARAGSGEHDPPGAKEALQYAQTQLSQRDVEFDVSATDRTGAFVGSLWLGKTNWAVELVSRGLAEVHGTAATMSNGDELAEAEQKARSQRLGIWKSEVAPVEPVNSTADQEPEYAEVIVTDIRGDGADEPFGFSVQVQSGLDQLDQVLADLSISADHSPVPPGYKPRPGDWVAIGSAASGWSRGVVQRAPAGTKGVRVRYADYGHVVDVPSSSVRPLDSKFGRTRLAPQACEARLAFVNLWDAPGDDTKDAIASFRELVENRKLLAKIVYRETAAPKKGPWSSGQGSATHSSQSGAMHVVLYDPLDERILDPAESINRDLVSAGWAIPDRKDPAVKRYSASAAHALTTNAIADAYSDARRSRAGIFLYGDPTADDE